MSKQKRRLCSIGFAASLLAVEMSFAQSTEVDTATAGPNGQGTDETVPAEIPPAGTEKRDAPQAGAALSSAVIQVHKSDGQPASNVAVLAGIVMAPGQAPKKTLSAVSDEEGFAHFQGLPTSPGMQVSFWFELGGVPVARTHPMRLTPGKPLRMEMKLPRMTRNPEDVVIEHVRVVFNRAGALFEVVEIFHLSCPDDCVYYAPKTGFRIPLPRDAVAPRPMDDEDTGVRAGEDFLVVLEPISTPPAQASFVFNLPIEDEEISLRQPLPSKVLSAQAISTWVNEKRSSLRGAGFSEPRITETNRGLAAWTIAARNLDKEFLQITLSGVERGPAGLRRNVAFVLSIFLLALGIAAWIRSLRRRPKEETKDA